MKMPEVTGAQRIALAAPLIAILAIGLWPPWKLEIGMGDQRVSSRGFLFSPPQTVEMSGYDGERYDARCRAVGLDIPRLLIEWIVVAAGTVGAMVIIAPRRKPAPPIR